MYLTKKELAERLRVSTRTIYTMEKMGQTPFRLKLWRGDSLYIYRWGNNPKRAGLKGRRCRVLARGKMNSIMVEFEDGSREITSRNAVRKADNCQQGKRAGIAITLSR